MGLSFGMWAECSTEQACVALVNHFDGLKSSLLTGRTVHWKAGQEPAFATAMTVQPLFPFSSNTVEGVVETTEAGLRLYHHLKIGPDFRFARVAWEPHLVPLAELSECRTEMDNGYRLDIQCVIDEPLYRQLGSPLFCYPFRDGYWWTRYSGEKYSPLYSRDQEALNALCRSLFPEYFKY